ncbi:hypothetical protein CNR22_16895 [Sphingobacteriaceae bacterium]|nr:hypothetical protein CNR22_16895 [Sphingobacteriaceae bacterium]
MLYCAEAPVTERTRTMTQNERDAGRKGRRTAGMQDQNDPKLKSFISPDFNEAAPARKKKRDTRDLRSTLIDM